MTLKTAMSAALLAFGAAPLFAPVAMAQVPAAQPPRALELGNEERGPVTALQAAAAGLDRTAQDSALVAARAAVRSAAGRYALGHYQFEIARTRGDAAMQSQAVDLMVQSGLASAAELPGLLSYQALRAYAASDMQGTDRLLARIVELQPNNPIALADYGQFRSRLASRGPQAVTDRTVAVSLFQRALAASEAAGRPAPQGWYLRALAVGYDSTRPPIGAVQLAPQTIGFARALVTAYPSPANWRDALLVYRDLVPTDPALDLDVRRLMRAAGATTGEVDYADHAAAAVAAGQIGEARAVIDEGVSRGMVEIVRLPPRLSAAIAAGAVAAQRGRLAAARTRAQAADTGAPALAAADSYLGFGQYGEAADLYRLALQKGGEDPNLVNLRLGAALALAGRRPEAELALRAVVGPRADLAGFWLIWLARRPV